MRRQISSKSDTCTESADVYVTDISAKVRAHYPGRSGVPILRHQKSANAVVGARETTSTEGQHVKERTDVLNFRYDDGDAE
jgi:hypothetical protein